MSNTINEKKEENLDQTYPQDITSYKPIRVIGRGSFGFLYEAIIVNGNHKDESVAVKEVKLDQLNEKSMINFQVNKLIYNLFYHIFF